MEFEEMFAQELEDIKRELLLEAESKILEQIPVDTGELKESLEVFWEDDNLVATTDTEYDTFVRFGHITSSGSMVEGRDYLDIKFEFEGDD